MPAGDGSKVRANGAVLPVYGYQKAFDRLLRDLRVEKA
jgi:hypothetical protein